MKFSVFPFTAIIGQEHLKKALILNAIDPTIGGVLIKGDKGTGKSTAVRAFAELLPAREVVDGCTFNCNPNETHLLCQECKKTLEQKGRLPTIKRKMSIVELPVSATEDMVVGSLDIKKALREGIKALEPGILARANGNILYIDEVNLLDDHVVNVLLDAAAMGVNIIEREGVSVSHPSKFILVGTMNPEEGDLRPQILDRFGLCVEIKALTDPQQRLKIIKYRMKFDENPIKFQEKFRKKQKRLQKMILNAKKLLDEVEISEDLLELIVKISAALGIRTHRADIITAKAATAIAAFNQRKKVKEEDVKEAALLALKHRIKQLPFEKEQEIDEELIEELIEEPEDDFEIDKKRRLKKDVKIAEFTGTIQGKNSANITGKRGKYIKAKETTNPDSIAIDATIKKAIRENPENPMETLPEHLMEKVRISKAEALYLILLDSSSSMKLDKKIKFAKTIAWLLLKESYEKKNKVGLISFKGDEAQIISEPTTDLTKVNEALENLQIGGKTPLTPALMEAAKLASQYKELAPTIIVISDGRCNIFIKSNLEEDLKILYPELKKLNLIFVDAEPKGRNIGVLEEIANKFNAPIFYLDDILI
ncbi:MAG TPA: VWA domain-containing protein [Methanothermobacter sp.]|nr:cobaltochelatase subunit-like protein [Methanothermobacter sp. MT-2]HHW05079.1 VWA domain-containing protein [Methanothermobacter sp.]HOK73448.1 VWA domain-containing protein [Methanothermobacter sp.]HOL68706.1 VWA domain-containing protein [Methanothermobacter sp.]HPQ05340.1 VWA domain-containing protein [Methanothermobacter sp.]